MWNFIWKEFFHSRIPRGRVEWNFQVLLPLMFSRCQRLPNACPGPWWWYSGVDETVVQDSEERFDEIHYSMMGYYKLVVMLFNLVPYLVLRLVQFN